MTAARVPPVRALGERRPSFAYARPLRVGVVLPEDDVVYYDVPTGFTPPNHNHIVVKDHPVLVDLRTRHIVEVIE
ncbi:DUF1236 domain-containing protein [Methylobacterium sp. E-005]|uniref:DUF1236 domain-containing protein n=1 Tax=Methylobacterium sp. E-005 TaxID=2836549 RepID=UPI001FB8B66C|nr:DUF1236 domain-containing protein [Methylobacterium sp. E-005]MCJ2087227.1 DUF1236 domain-containing protein [Methylobacterium sp. E-005]